MKARFNKILILFAVLLFGFGQMWGDVTYAPVNNPATKTYAELTFLDVANTHANGKITADGATFEGDSTLAYSLRYVGQTLAITTWYNCSDGSPASNFESSPTYTDAEINGFVAPSSTSGNIGYGGAKAHSSRIRYFYVTGVTSVAIISHDNGSSKYVQLKIEEVAANGSLSEVSTIDSPNKSSSTLSLIEYTTALNPAKYYKISCTSNNSSNCKVYQIRFGKYIAPACTAPTGVSVGGGGEYTVGGEITLEGSATDNVGASTTYTWYKGDTWDAAKVTTPIQAAATASDGGNTFIKSGIALGDAGTYWCSIANSTCEAHASAVVTVVPAGGTKYDITYTNVLTADNSANPTQYTEGVGVASFVALADIADHHFIGWNPPSIAADAVGDKTIDANWVAAYNVSFEKGDATGTAPAGFQKWEGATFELPGQGDMVAPTGRVFGGWKVGVSGKYAAGDTYTMGTTSVEFIAQWDLVLEQVIYSWEGAEGGATEVGGTVSGSAENLINQPSAGYYCLKIDGNNSYSGNLVTITLSGEEKVKTGDKITYWGFYNKSSSANARPKMRDANGSNAQIFDDPTNLPNLNGGGDPAVRTFTVPEGINTNAVQLTRSQTGSNTWIPKIQITREKAVPEEDIRTVTFNTNGGSSIAAVSVEKGTAVARPADPTKAHCRFAGWQLSGSAYDFSSAVNSNITLDAVWTQLYTISFAAGEGSGDAPAAIADKANGETFEVPANTFTAPASKEFDKWNDGTNDYAPGATYTVGSANVVLTALWKAAVEKFTVIYMDGADEMGREAVDVGSHPTASAIDKTKPLHTFSNWRDALDNPVNLADVSGAKDEEITVYATWNKAYANSVDFEAYILANTGEADDADKAKAYVEGQNYALSTKTNTTFDANNSTNNGAYAGLKIKNSGTTLSWNVAAGKVVEFKAGVMVANGSLSINGGAATTIDGGSTGSGDNFKTHYFYSAAEALYVFTTSNNSAEVIKAITMRDPYQVNFDDDGADDPVAAQWAYPSVTLPSATKGTQSLLGWFDDATAGNKIGEPGDTYTPTSNTMLYAHWEAVSTDARLASISFSSAAGTLEPAFDPEVVNYTYTMPYPTAAVPTITGATSVSTKAQAPEIVSQAAAWNETAVIRGVAESGDKKTYNITMKIAPKDGVSIIKVATTGGTNKTVTGLYAGDGDVNLSSSKKMDNGKYIGFTLDGTTLQAGDRINVHTSTAANTVGSHIIFYDNMTAKNELYETGEIGGLGDNIFEINAAMVGSATAYVYRANNDAAHQWNGYVDFIEVTRAMNPVLTAIQFNSKDVTVSSTSVSATLPNGTNLGTMTVTPTIVWNGAGTAEVTSNAGAWVWGPNTYVVTDKDGDATTYTITLSEDVLKHTVSFNTHGGSAVASVEVEHNGYLAAAPADPTKEDNIFQYWSLSDGGAEVDVTTVQIDEDKTFHAVWAAETGVIKLIDGEGNINTTDFITAVTAGTVNFDDEDHNCATFGSTASTIVNQSGANKFIVYNARTNQTKIKFVLYNTNSSAQKIVLQKLAEGEDATTDIEIDVPSKVRFESEYYTYNSDANRTMYVFTKNTNIKVLQVKVVDDGTPVKQAGEAGYSLNLNVGRVFAPAGTEVAYDGLTMNAGSNYKVLNSTEIQTLENISFTVASPLTMRLVSTGAKYQVSTDAAGSGDEYSAGTNEHSLTAGTWYIVATTTSNMKFANIAFVAPKCAEPAFNALANSDICSGDPYVALNGTATVADAGVPTYQWYREDNTAIDGETNATYTPAADGKYYVIAVNHLAGFSDNEKKSDLVTVTTHAGTAITGELADQRGNVDDEVTLEVVAGGKNVHYAWKESATIDGTYTDVAGAADAASLNVTITDGMDKYYKVVVSSDCGADQESVAHVTQFVPVAQQNVTGTIAWNWANAASVAEIKLTSSTAPKKNEGFVMANGAATIYNNANFESDKLYLEGEYIIRDSKYFQGQTIKFNTTVAGAVRVKFSHTGNSKPARELYINGVGTGDSRTSATAAWSRYVEVPAGEVTITAYHVDPADGAGQQYIRVPEIEFLALDKVRDDSWLAPGELGTICYPNGHVVVGAEVYEMAGVDANNKFVFDEVEVTEPGKPYLFVAKSSNPIKFYKTTADAVAEAGTSNGMVGTFVDLHLSNTDPLAAKWYYFSGTKFYSVGKYSGNVLIPANRAYVDMNEPHPAMAPRQGVRRITFDVQGTNTATRVENVQGDKVQGTKVLIDGNLYILRGEKMFDATGRLVK